MGPRSPVPVTLVSGFLGAGKTTLLKAVLKNKAGLRCAVLVNDLASLNVDTEIINKSKTLKDSDALVHIENGCVCCNQNGKLLDQVVKLAKTGQYDNMIIETSGVAEPESVAYSLEGVKQFARLDTCVTVVDCSMFFRHLHSDKRLRDTELAEGEDADETEQLTSQLLVNQVEFADVVLLNKTDLLGAEDLEMVQATVEKLNPRARLLCCSHSQVDVADVLSTNRFSIRDTPTQVHSCLNGNSGAHHDVEKKLKRAVTSFVYTARMPFHPARLHAFATRYFQLHQQDWSGALADTAPDRAAADLRRAAAAAAAAAAALPQRGGAAHAAAQLAADAARHAAALAAVGAAASVENSPASDAMTPSPPPPAAPAKERSAEVGTILRSKGFIWLAGASRNDHCAQWSSAGEVLQLSTGGPWFSAVPAEAWPEDPSKREAILKDFLPGIGDRRQELVFIGFGLKEGAIRAALDAALATPLELLPDPSPSALCSTHLSPQLDAAVDPFAAWPPISELLHDPDAEDADVGVRSAGAAAAASPEALDAAYANAAAAIEPAAAAVRAVDTAPQHFFSFKSHRHDDTCGHTQTHAHVHADGHTDGGAEHPEGEAEEEEEEVELEDAQWMPGEVLDIFAGGAETAASLNAAADMGLRAVAVLWHAPWVEASVAAEAALARAAAAHPHVMCLCLAVDASSDNKNFALEQVMKRRESSRRGAHPVLKSGGRWPAITMHDPPLLHPVHRFEGDDAAAALADHLAALAAEEPADREGDEDSADSSQEQLPSDVSGAAPKGDAPPASRGRAVADKARSIVIVKRGVSDLKQLLSNPDVTAGSALLMLVEDSSAPGALASPEAVHAAWHAAAEVHKDVVFATLDRAVSEANRLLATKLGCPSLMLKHASKTHIITDVTPATLAATLSRCSSTPAATQPPSNTLSSTPGANINAPTPAQTGDRKRSQFDPPEGSARRPGTCKVFAGKGEAVYWPRMPCLRCGCPWWLGEDWDALCVRCGWCCESEGYDNESKPLQTGGWLERYEEFTACLKQGYTAAWPPKGGAAKGKGRSAARM